MKIKDIVVLLKLNRIEIVDKLNIGHSPILSLKNIKSNIEIKEPELIRQDSFNYYINNPNYSFILRVPYKKIEYFLFSYEQHNLKSKFHVDMSDINSVLLHRFPSIRNVYESTCLFINTPMTYSKEQRVITFQGEHIFLMNSSVHSKYCIGIIPLYGPISRKFLNMLKLKKSQQRNEFFLFSTRDCHMKNVLQYFESIQSFYNDFYETEIDYVS